MSWFERKISEQEYEISSLKVELDKERSSFEGLLKVHDEEFDRAEKAERQLAEARAEVDRLTLENRQMLQGMKWDNQLKAIARQEAAREILQIISMETIDRPFEQSQAVEIIRQRFGLEG